MLDKIRLSFSCNELWERMRGNEQARFCERCQKTVYNLSAMTTAEAEATLCGPGDPPCVRYMRMADGRVHTRDRVLPRVALTAGLAAAAGAAMYLGDQPEARPACAEATGQSATTVENDSPSSLIPEISTSNRGLQPLIESQPHVYVTGGIRAPTIEMGDVAIEQPRTMGKPEQPLYEPIGRVRRND